MPQPSEGIFALVIGMTIQTANMSPTQERRQVSAGVFYTKPDTQVFSSLP